VITDCSELSLNPSAERIDGSATFITETSIATISWATHATTSVALRPLAAEVTPARSQALGAQPACLTLRTTLAYDRPHCKLSVWIPDIERAHMHRIYGHSVAVTRLAGAARGFDPRFDTDSPGVVLFSTCLVLILRRPSTSASY
jgi:hypothetical protein